MPGEDPASQTEQRQYPMAGLTVRGHPNSYSSIRFVTLFRLANSLPMAVPLFVDLAFYAHVHYALYALTHGSWRIEESNGIFSNRDSLSN